MRFKLIEDDVCENQPSSKKSQNDSIKDYARYKLNIPLNRGATVHHKVSHRDLIGIPNRKRIENVIIIDGGSFELNDVIHRMLHYIADKEDTYTLKDIISEIENSSVYVFKSTDKDAEYKQLKLKDIADKGIKFDSVSFESDEDNK